jgi:HlyD family secretion protein
MRRLGDFATWRAARAVGDYDLNTFAVRADPLDHVDGLEPGMTVWLSPP